MKKIIAILLTVALGMFACAGAELAGGWTINTLNEGETSTEIEFVEGQVATLATQLVAGTNYCLLVRDAESYQLVYVYEQLDGRYYVVKSEDLVRVSTGLAGSWTLANDVIPADVFEKAASKMMGAGYEVAATLATQVVAGTNYMLLCKITPVVPNAESHYAVVTVYADLSGNAEITNVTDIELSIQ